MAARDPQLQEFLDRTESAIGLRASRCAGAGPAAQRIFAALRGSVGSLSATAPASLPVLAELPPAMRIAAGAAPPVSHLAMALAALAPRLLWMTRPGAEAEGQAFCAGHANAHVIGPQGLEQRGDVMVGISLLAPNLRYPVHRHPPEEVYVSLAGGSWWKSGGPWHEPGPGGLVYNEPGIDHAMATAAQPLLAVWSLWVG